MRFSTFVLFAAQLANAMSDEELLRMFSRSSRNRHSGCYKTAKLSKTRLLSDEIEIFRRNKSKIGLLLNCFQINDHQKLIRRGRRYFFENILEKLNTRIRKYKR
ncbi:unnamed protein product [Oikopleura dioica]|uniref:Uncharacterized protein n=1 Tax=Oikopleura dioica TaxID=34765 RepID=E4YHL0_OIKDI|nr:unnamed protein product [Oikopleura dioica]